MIDLDDVWDIMHEASKILTITNFISLPVLALALTNFVDMESFFFNYFGVWLIILVCVVVTWETWLCRF